MADRSNPLVSRIGPSTRAVALEPRLLAVSLSEHTVRNHLIRFFDKLGISSRVELVLYAFSASEEDVESGARKGSFDARWSHRQLQHARPDCIVNRIGNDRSNVDDRRLATSRSGECRIVH